MDGIAAEGSGDHARCFGFAPPIDVYVDDRAYTRKFCHILGIEFKPCKPLPGLGHFDITLRNTPRTLYWTICKHQILSKCWFIIVVNYDVLLYDYVSFEVWSPRVDTIRLAGRHSSWPVAHCWSTGRTKWMTCCRPVDPCMSTRLNKRTGW